MESILVGVDHSENARRAAQFAIERAAANGWKVLVAHVVYWSKFAFPTPEENEARPGQVSLEKERAQAQVIDPIVEWARSQGHDRTTEIETRVLHGRPSEVIADLADSGSFDMIVVARTGESHLRNAIFGSTVNRLVQHAPIPVVVVP
ncbi:nucleotide-binding universal stress UspA family protein [Brevibacterium sanguinis]|uniref:Nucleotide-binding universal stress UspA family protein n=2 Tax=Brevibacterium TaxID=1696 RepID=A0A366IM52_9MICO|nr:MULTISPECIES: universal stress protein [Brevibacterium]RBP65718.1 nucleotide-binding universal stress UspA family protein [Brevibacterium sanguinis]RBP72352.1 nucleotide-binding universal stress UspA family protein [Brevibacterium celere]